MMVNIRWVAWALIGAAVMLVAVATAFVALGEVPNDTSTVICFGALGLPLGIQVAFAILLLQRSGGVFPKKPQ